MTKSARVSLLSIALLSVLSLSSMASENNIDKYKTIAKGIITNYNKNDYKNISNDFNPVVSDMLSENKIKAFVESLQAQYGKIKNIGEPIALSESTYSFPMELEKGKLNLILSFDNNDKIAEILFKPAAQVAKYPDVTKDTDVNDIIQAYTSQKNVVGLSVGMIDASGKENEVFYGNTAKNKDKKVNEFTIFEIGSISKVFTSTALADLSLNGKLKLTDPIEKYLPSTVKVPSFNNKKITFVDLATHTSGLPRLPEDLTKTVTDNNQPYENYSKDNIYNFLSNYKIKTEPGKNYNYSNLGAGLLGDILADIDKTSYEEMIKKHITDKLNMVNTGINFNRTQIMNFSTGYDESGNDVPMWVWKSMQGAGAIKSSLNDMMKFLNANIFGAKDKDLTNAMELAQKPEFKADNFEVGLGWHISKLDTGDSITWHNGGTAGYRTYIGFIKDKKVGVVVLSNSAISVDQLGVLILKKLSYK